MESMHVRYWRRWASAVFLAMLVSLAAASAWWRDATRTVPLPPGWRAVVTVLAGDGRRGVLDGAAGEARFMDPYGVAVAGDGTVYVADGVPAHRIRAISRDGMVTTIAGGRRGLADGRGTEASFDSPSGLAIGPDGVLYVADTGNHAIRRVTPDGFVTTLAGGGGAGYRDGSAAVARFNGPVGVAVDARGHVVVADTYNDRVRVIDRAGYVSTLAGDGTPGVVDGPAAAARFDTPCGVAVAPDGTVFVADTGNHVVRRVDSSGTVSTVGGTAGAPAGMALWRPMAVTTGDGRWLYVTDARARVVELASTGETRVLAGSTPGFAHGSGEVARFRNPVGVTMAGAGRLIVADTGNALIREVAATTRLAFRSPPSPRLAPHFDIETFAWLPLLWPVDPMTAGHEVAGTLAEARGEGRERFHAGVDIREPEGTVVSSVRAGTVEEAYPTDGFGTLGEWLLVGPIGYVHVRVGRDRHDRVLDPAKFQILSGANGRPDRIRVRRGTRFGAGEPIATVNRFNHVHLSVGWSGAEYNPLTLRLPGFEDTIAPTIVTGGIRLFDAYGRPLVERVRGRVRIGGRVHIVVEAWDRMNLNPPRRRLGLYRLGFQLLERDGSPVPGFEMPRETIRFDQLDSNPVSPRLVYAPGSGIPFYGERATRFLYQVTSTYRKGEVVEGSLDAAGLTPGDYVLRILAEDVRGNAAIAGRDLPITVLP
jgi:hypothetical protein